MMNPAFGSKPLGPVITPDGVRFSLASEHATRVELCLFDSVHSKKESRRIDLARNGNRWETHIPGAGPGCLYAFRVYGPYDPASGHRFNPAKLVVDPYARALGRRPQWHDALFTLPPSRKKNAPDIPDGRDAAPFAPLCQVADTAFDWEGDQPPDVPWEDTILYETHVKGITARHPDLPPELRGTFAGLGSKPVIDHLTGLGVTTLELMPVQQSMDEYHLHQKHLTNYWGYNTLLFFAPDNRFAGDSADPVREFKTMVRSLHRAGLEVILDVVYNHTPEGNEYGPTVSFRGIDNRNYYLLDADDPSRYLNFTGCGNTLNVQHPMARQLVLDSLRYWVTEMRVDGFRFDLAVSLGREQATFQPHAEFFQAIADDPVLARVKLIAEPWDMGPDGYKVSAFSALWSEWNNQFLQTMRRFWRGDAAHLGLWARRFSGSADMYQPGNRLPRASVNYIACHDGFTLEDTVSYKNKHNQLNRENNQDGTGMNDSHNYGVEGPTRDPAIRRIRLRQKKNLMATLLLSLGTPMISGGDEIGRTQKGNNNAYCQDNGISWHDWQGDEASREFLEFTRRLVRLRKQVPLFRRGRFFVGEDPATGVQDVAWYAPTGREMEQEDWDDADSKCLGCLLQDTVENHSPADPASPDAFLLLINADVEATDFALPGLQRPGNWHVSLHTGTKTGIEKTPYPPGEKYLLDGQTLVVFQWREPSGEAALP